MTPNRKTKRAVRAYAEQNGSRYARSLRMESDMWRECFSILPDSKRPKLSVITEYVSQSPATASVPPVKVMGYRYAQQPRNSPERMEDQRRDQAMVHMSEDDPRLEPMRIDERRLVREHTVEQYLRVVSVEHEVQSMVEGNVALVPAGVTDADGNQVFGALDFDNFCVLVSEDTNKDIFSNPYLTADCEVVDGEMVQLEDVVKWNAVVAREALIGSKIRGIKGLELCTRIGYAAKGPHKWNDDVKLIHAVVVCDGIEPSAVCERLDEIREALGVQSIGASPEDAQDEDIITDSRNPLICTISKPKTLSLVLCNRPMDDTNRAALGLGMSRYVSSAGALDSSDRT